MDPNKNENTSQGKRKANPESYSRNIIKKSRVKAEPYKNYKGDDIPGRTLGPPCRQDRTLDESVRKTSSAEGLLKKQFGIPISRNGDISRIRANMIHGMMKAAIAHTSVMITSNVITRKN
ncbi:unnamed protein product [Psylliodes chrysocephalus]|uniref:Uncharacterized protein n=1 Tax=Psylliodes chrysocephalus TaxID=3402493 RepID=A0A9P0CI48_9CUCU|nr:unnamed protein product [Psylliodes chrysocephala]